MLLRCNAYERPPVLGYLRMLTYADRCNAYERPPVSGYLLHAFLCSKRTSPRGNGQLPSIYCMLTYADMQHAHHRYLASNAAQMQGDGNVYLSFIVPILLINRASLCTYTNIVPMQGAMEFTEWIILEICMRIRSINLTESRD